MLTAAGLGGCAANALQTALGRGIPEQRERRGWTEQRWADALAGLRDRGWVDADGVATETGRAERERLEEATDLACAAGLSPTTRNLAATLTDPLLTIARSAADTGAVTFPNPSGVARP